MKHKKVSSNPENPVEESNQLQPQKGQPQCLEVQGDTDLVSSTPTLSVPQSILLTGQLQLSQDEVPSTPMQTEPQPMLILGEQQLSDDIDVLSLPPIGHPEVESVVTRNALNS